MRAAEKLADADADLIAGDRSGDEVAARGAEVLGGGKRWRKDHRRRMEHRAVVDVVLLGDVRGGGIDQRGEQRRGHLPRRRGSRSAHRPAPSSPRIFPAMAIARWPRAGQRRTRPVDEEIHRAVDHRLRNVLEAQAGGEGGERRRFRCRSPRAIAGFAIRCRLPWSPQKERGRPSMCSAT